MKKIKILLSFSLIITLLTGCSDSSNASTILFANSIAIQYEDNQYHVYMQFVNIDSLARQELESGTSKADYIVVDGKGDTITEAITNISGRLRSTVELTQINSIILMDGMLTKEQLENFFVYCLYDSSIRFTTYLFYSTLDPNDLYAVDYQLSGSSYYSLINPTQTEELPPLITPNTLLEAIKYYYEGYNTYRIPILNIDEESTINADGEIKNIKLFNITNNLFISEKDHFTELENEQLKGLHWLTSGNKVIQEAITVDDYIITFTLTKQSTTRSYDKANKKYKIKFKGDIYILRISNESEIKDAVPIIKEYIKNQIMETYIYGVENDTDVYNLLPYSTIFENQSEELTEDNIEIEVSLKTELKGSYLTPKEKITE